MTVILWYSSSFSIQQVTAAATKPVAAKLNIMQPFINMPSHISLHLQPESKTWLFYYGDYKSKIQPL